MRNADYEVPKWYKMASPDRYHLLKAYAKENRNHQTEAEAALWKMIKGNALGTKFLRQYVIQDYIADFAALEDMLIIEVDGGYHYCDEQMLHDAYRTEDLETIGFKVIRFSNDEVLFKSDQVIDRIIFELNHITRTKKIIK